MTVQVTSTGKEQRNTTEQYTDQDPLRYFLGKLCTILCVESLMPVNDASTYYKMFLGTIKRIDSHGIMIEHVNKTTRAFFFRGQIAGIIEEQITMIDDESAKELKTQVAEKKAEKELTIDSQSGNIPTTMTLSSHALDFGIPPEVLPKSDMGIPPIDPAILARSATPEVKPLYPEKISLESIIQQTQNIKGSADEKHST